MAGSSGGRRINASPVPSQWPLPPFAIHRGSGRGPFVLLCEHASWQLPDAYAGLGLDETDLRRHIGWDLGANALAMALSDRLDAPLVHATWSRLLLDLNRPPLAADAIPARSEDTAIPGNQGIAPEQRQLRHDAVYVPYHGAVAKLLEQRAAAGMDSFVVSMHSFTPVYHGVPRPWHCGVISNDHRDFADGLLDHLRGDPSLCVGDNLPYGATRGLFHSIELHADRRGLHGLMIEVRNDLLTNSGALDGSGINAWAARLSAGLRHAQSRLASSRESQAP